MHISPLAYLKDRSVGESRLRKRKNLEGSINFRALAPISTGVHEPLMRPGRPCRLSLHEASKGIHLYTSDATGQGTANEGGIREGI